MKNLFTIADTYIEESDWKTIAALKFCLIPLGVLAGMSIPKRYRKTATIVCGTLFTATYIPLMAKLFEIALRDEDQKDLPEIITENNEE